MPRKVTAPIARSTAYDFNCHLESSHTRPLHTTDTQCVLAACDKECQDVMPHELLFTFDEGTVSKTSRMKAMSSLNGVRLPRGTVNAVNRVLQKAAAGRARDVQTSDGRAELAHSVRNLDTNDVELRQLNKALNKQVRYVGVAVTGCTGGASNALQRQGFSATRGGLMTIMNTGEKTIRPGQKICAELDVRDIAGRTAEQLEGVPREKILLRLQPVQEDDDLLHDLGNAIDAEGQYMHIDDPVGPLLPFVPYLVRGEQAYDI